MRIIYFVLLLLTGLSSGAQALRQRLDSFFRLANTRDEFQGNVLIASGDTILYQGYFGMADEELKRSLNDSSVFELASVSKQFTAMGILLLEQKGLLKLTDSLRHFFPELPYSGVTVAHLVYHTGGLPDYLDLVKLNTPRGHIVGNEELISLLVRFKPKPDFAPGKKWAYSNTGYALLASIIEKVSGQSFSDFLRLNIFQPLGMHHTEVYRRRFEKRTIDNYAYGYVKDSSGRFILPDKHPNFSDMVTRLDGIVGDGTVNSTTGDLYTWSRALDQNRLIPASVLTKAFTSGILNNGDPVNYAFGWILDSLAGIGKVVSHGGGWPGYGTWIQKHLQDGRLIIILSNHGQSRMNTDKLLDIMYEKHTPPAKAITLQPALLAAYPGTYEIVPQFSITITTDQGRLFAQASGQEKFEVFPEAKDLFFYKVVEAKLRFNRNEEGEVISLTLLQNRRELEGKKIN